jgi:enamine deaminase RidA (YjgF/YER057c/UK114 family)
MLRVIQDALGTVDRVEKILKVTALVNGVPGFSELPQVADGFTDAMTEALGARGMHARSAMGATNLNNNVPIICDAIIQVRD